MDKALPVVIVCSVGMACCVAYMVFLCIKSVRRRPKRKHEFEIEENVLTIKLGNKKHKS